MENNIDESPFSQNNSKPYMSNQHLHALLITRGSAVICGVSLTLKFLRKASAALLNVH